MASSSVSGESFDLARVLSTSFSAIARNWKPVFGFALIGGLLTAGFTALQMNGVSDLMAARSTATSGASPEQAVQLQTAASLSLFKSPLYWLGVIGSIFASSFTNAGLVRGLIGQENGDAASLGACLSTALRFGMPMFVLTFLWALGVSFGMILLIIPAVILLTMWSVSVPVLIVEKTGVIGAFGRSRALTKGYRWAVFGTLLVFTILYAIVSSAATGFSSTGLLKLYQSSAFLGFGLSLAVSTLLAPVLTSFLVALYQELRLVKEGGGAKGLAEVFA
ncbi:MAG: hypothetical protein RIS52_1363 [Pseudomonadota bacterium]